MYDTGVDTRRAQPLEHGAAEAAPATRTDAVAQVPAEFADLSS